MGSVSGIGLAIVLAVAQNGPRKDAVDAAIDRGVEHLLELYADGEGRDVSIGAPRLTLLDKPGLRALTVYALLSAGVEAEHTTVERLVASLSFERFDETYDTACMLLALTKLDPVGQRAWIDELAVDLLAWQEERGDWGYPEGGDLSNTQYAALALRAAQAIGVEVGLEVWSDLARAVLQYRNRDGGFAYVVVVPGRPGGCRHDALGAPAPTGPRPPPHDPG